MPADQHVQDADKPRPRPLQFTLHSMFWLMTGMAVYLSILVSGPDWLFKLSGGLLLMAAPAVLTIVIVYGRGYARAFCIGAMFPAVMGAAQDLEYLHYLTMPFQLWMDSTDSTEPVEALLDAYRLFDTAQMTVHFLFMIAFGLLAIWVRRTVEPIPSVAENRSDDPTTDTPKSPST